MSLPRLFTICALLAAVACAEATGLTTSQEALAGLVQGAASDSGGGPVTTPGLAGPGYFRGYVRAPNGAGAGGDTLAASPRIAGVVVRAYRILGTTPEGPTLGALAGEVTTNADGAFTFATIPGGEYAVTFRPPPSASYQGIWVWAEINTVSHVEPWWVTLIPR